MWVLLPRNWPHWDLNIRSQELVVHISYRCQDCSTASSERVVNLAWNDVRIWPWSSAVPSWRLEFRVPLLCMCTHTHTYMSFNMSGHITEQKNEPKTGRHWEGRGEALAETCPKQCIVRPLWTAFQNRDRKCRENKKESLILVTKAFLPSFLWV